MKTSTIRLLSWNRWQEALERRRQRQMLLQMSDHMLKDIGISRYDAHQEASKGLWED